MARDLDDYDCMHNSNPVCPRCGVEFDLTKGGRAIDVNYEEGGHTDCKCDGCGKMFVAVTEYIYAYSTAIDEDHASDELWGPQDEEKQEFEVV